MSSKIQELPRHQAVEDAWQILVRDLVLPASVGVYPHERGTMQPVRINIILDALPPAHSQPTELEDVLCYDMLVREVKQILAKGHIGLVETLAEYIADAALAHPLSLRAEVRVEKLSAIAEAESVGVQLTRYKS